MVRKLLSPLGALAMLLSCWLPWAEVSCGTVYTTPTYWQLADYDHRLYWLAGLAVLVLLSGIWMCFQRSVTAAIVHLVGALACVAGWCFLWLKREDLAAYQAEVQGLGGDLAKLASDLSMSPGAGFKLYLAGAVLALTGALAGTLRRRSPGRSAGGA